MHPLSLTAQLLRSQSTITTIRRGGQFNSPAQTLTSTLEAIPQTLAQLHYLPQARSWDCVVTIQPSSNASSIDAWVETQLVQALSETGLDEQHPLKAHVCPLQPASSLHQLMQLNGDAVEEQPAHTPCVRKLHRLLKDRDVAVLDTSADPDLQLAGMSQHGGADNPASRPTTSGEVEDLLGLMEAGALCSSPTPRRRVGALWLQLLKLNMQLLYPSHGRSVSPTCSQHHTDSYCTCLVLAQQHTLVRVVCSWLTLASFSACSVHVYPQV